MAFLYDTQIGIIFSKVYTELTESLDLLSTMASSNRSRKAIDLEPYRDEIILLYSSSTLVNSIRTSL